MIMFPALLCDIFSSARKQLPKSFANNSNGDKNADKYIHILRNILMSIGYVYIYIYIHTYIYICFAIYTYGDVRIVSPTQWT